MADEIAGMVVKLAMEDGSFQEGIANINRQMKVVDSEFKSATGGAKDFGNSLDGLNANIDRLNQSTKLQTQLVEMYQKRLDQSKATLEQTVKSQEKLTKELDDTKKAHEEATKSLGKNSKEAEELKKKLDDLQKKYDDNSQKIRNNVKQIDNHTISVNKSVSMLKKMETQLKEAEDAAEKFGKDIENSMKGSTGGIDIMNVAMGNLLANGVEGLIDGVIELTQQTMEWASIMQKTADQTGFTIDEVQRWDAILKTTGADIDTLQGSLADFQERMLDASNGTGDGKEVFDALGIAVTDVNGKLRSTQSVFNETIFALQNMDDQTMKSAYATTLLSTAGEDLAQVLNMTNAELSNAKARVNIVSQEDIDAINEFKANIMEFLDAVGKPLIGFLGDVITLLNPILDLLTMIVGPLLSLVEDFTSVIADVFRGNKELEEDMLGQNADNIAGMYTNAEEQVKDSLGNIKGDTKDTFEYLNKAMETFNNNALREKEKQLRDRYNTGSRRDEERIQKELERYKQQLTRETEAYEQNAKRRTEIEEREVKRRQELYANSKNKYSGSGSYPKYAYAVGTKYHPGGMALVGENGPELIDIPQSAKVYTNAHTQQIMNQSKQVSGATYNLNNVTIQTSNAKDLFNQIQILVRRGAFS